MMNNVISFYLFQGGSAGGSMVLLLLLPMMFIGMLYFQQRKQKRWQEHINSLKNGDRVTTSGGIRGLVIALKDDAVHLRVPPDNLRLEVAKAAITAINREDEEKKST